ncbi:cytochrome C biogenesis protein [Neisseria sp. HMSC70E02]|uniref:cytochrome C biogenesis protein n=1 Tax=Neisseria sp. HMSC70E02 TaxID=1608896 RepID=UPI001FEF17D3|nr:cytochrome C biogenesis protein [Neisseria sp. HMSC70E02]
MERKKACLVILRVTEGILNMLNELKKFIQKYWVSILISSIFFWLWMVYYGDNSIVKLVVFPIISFFLVILFHLELERKNIKYLSIIQMLIGMLLGLAIQIKRENFMLVEGLIFGGIWGLTTPIWVKIFLFLRQKIGDYV